MGAVCDGASSDKTIHRLDHRLADTTGKIKKQTRVDNKVEEDRQLETGDPDTGRLLHNVDYTITPSVDKLFKSTEDYTEVQLTRGHQNHVEPEKTEQITVPHKQESRVTGTEHSTASFQGPDTKIVNNKINTNNSLQQESAMATDYHELNDVKLGFDECVGSLKEKKDRKYFKQLADMFKDKMEVNSVYRYKKFEQRRWMGDYLCHLSYAKIAMDYYEFILKDIKKDVVTEVLLFEAQENPGIMLLLQIRTSLMNYADASYELGKAIADTNLFKYIVGDLKEICEEGIQDLQPKDEAFHSAVGILNNCGKSPLVYKSRFEEFHVIKNLSPFLDSKYDLIKVVTLLCLANIVSQDNDEDYRLLVGEKKVFDYYMEMIEKTESNELHTEGGFTLEELVYGLAKMLKNDKNRQMVMEEHGNCLLPQLKRMITEGSDKEKESAVKVVWELGFENKYKMELRKDAELLQSLQKLRSSPCESLSESAKNACFVLIGKDWKKDVGTGKPGHIMISYSWANQKILKKVYKSLLDKGHNVWMDIDRMEGSLLQTMADAVENASVVLICYSETYKESQNCRLEAEYAIGQHKPIIPLRLQHGYDPLGWLGIIVANKMYYEFTNKMKFSSKMDDLLNSTEKYKTENAISVKGEEKVSHRSKYGDVQEWTTSDVQKWLDDNNLTEYPQLQGLTGEHIDFLHELNETAPEFYFHCLQAKLDLNSLDELMKFNRAIKSL